MAAQDHTLRTPGPALEQNRLTHSIPGLYGAGSASHWRVLTVSVTLGMISVSEGILRSKEQRQPSLLSGTVTSPDTFSYK